MTQSKQSHLHFYLLLGALALALGLRLIRLAHLPLDDSAATLALQALAVAKGTDASFGAFPAYVGLTGLSFYLFAAGNFLARFWPALVGALIVFVPPLFRKWIGRWPATILSLVLAISPEMVGLSRIVGSPVMALVLLLLAVGLFARRKPALAGAALALALMSGAGFWMGVLILGLSYALSEWLFKVSDGFDLSEIEDKKGFWTSFGIAFGATLLVVGTGFFMAPANLSGVFGGLVAFVRGFAVSSGTPLVHYFLALIGYTSAALLVGLWGSARALIVRDKVDVFLLVWWVVGLSFVILYPAGGTADLIWVTLPLWLLAVRVMFFAWRLPETSRPMMGVMAIIVIIVLAFMLLAFRGLINVSTVQEQGLNFLLAILGGVTLLVATVLLVNFGWTQEVALSGLLLGLAVVFGLSLFSLSVQSTGLAPEPSVELWYPERDRATTEWLRLEMDRIIDWNARGAGGVAIAVSDYDLPSMRWFLRDDDFVQFVPYLPPESQPGVLITSAQEIPEIASGYRGQDLVWSQEVVWSEMTSFQYLRWLLTRDAPLLDQQVILWVRTDLMPDAQFSN